MGRGRWDPQLADEPLEGSVPSVNLLKNYSANRREQLSTRYFTSYTSRTVSPTLMGATRPEQVITGTAGDGTAERPRNWNEDLKTKKNTYSKYNEGIRGRRGVRLKDTTYGNVCEKSLLNTETCWTAGDPVRHGHAPVGLIRSKRKVIKEQHYSHVNMPGSWISQSRRNETRIRV